VYKTGAVTSEKLKAAAVSWRDVFDEIPISVCNRCPPRCRPRGALDAARLHVAHRLRKKPAQNRACTEALAKVGRVGAASAPSKAGGARGGGAARSTLGAALMVALEPDAATNAGDHERLDLGVAPLVEKNLEFLNDCLDDIVQEQQKARAPASRPPGRARGPPARPRPRGRALAGGRCRRGGAVGCCARSRRFPGSAACWVLRDDHVCALRVHGITGRQ